MNKKKLISIILPVYNEACNVPVLYEKIKTIMAQDLNMFEHELILVNDGSNDSSWQVIKQLCTNDPCIKGIHFTRNFGHQTALTAGYEVASGDAIITMDSDLQHPPEIIPAMIQSWQQGNEIVYIQNKSRNDSFLKKICSELYYKILDKISDTAMPHNVADFRLIDKKVLQILRISKEKSLYLRGIVAWTGFSYDIIATTFAQRASGKAGYTWWKMLKLAFDGFTSFSIFPLKIAAYVGLFVIITGTAMLAFITGEALIFRAHYPLFKWLVTIIYIFLGVLFILLWILGEYIGRMYEELKGRPLYIVKETFNLDQSVERSNYVFNASTIGKSKTDVSRSTKNRDSSHSI